MLLSKTGYKQRNVSAMYDNSKQAWYANVVGDVIAYRVLRIRETADKENGIS